MKKIDVYRQRARAICAAKNFDPDSMVPWGTLLRPQWLDFRDEAKRQILAELNGPPEDAVSSRPQGEQYQDRPLTVFGKHEDATLKQMDACMKVGNVMGAVICADGHLGYSQPVGGVIAYERQISISGVGYDIACGNMAVRLDVEYADIASHATDILADIRKRVSFGVGQMNDERVEHTLFDDENAWRSSGMMNYRDKSRASLGSVGGGNHYVDLLRDDSGFVWIGVHFGSRGLGHTTATRFAKAAGGGRDEVNGLPVLVDDFSDLGAQYLAAMELAGRYAYAGREAVVERVRRIVGGSILDTIHNHHNYCWRESHGGRDLWVVRKGATPAFPGQRGFVGGSMGDDAVIVEGVDSDLSRDAFYSTIHGAGRTFGRMEAKRRFSREEMDAWLRERGVLVSGGDVDESPMAYRRLPEVLAAQGGTINVLHTLRPFAVAMAGSTEYDPWKD